MCYSPAVQFPMSGRLKWIAVLVFVPVAWGYNWVVMKRALSYAGPFEFSAARFVLGSICLFAVLAMLGRPVRIRPLGAVFWAGLLQTGGNFGFLMWALTTGPAGRSALLCYTMPFWVVLLAWPALGERPSRPQWLAAAVACAGLALIFLSGGGGGSTQASGLATLGGLSWAGGTLIARRLLTKSTVDPLALTAWQMLFGGLALTAAALLAPARSFVWSPYLFFALAYTIIPASVVAWLFWFTFLQRTEASVASLTLLATPVLGIIFGALELGERPRGLELLGMALITLALLIIGPLAVRRHRALSPAKLSL